MVSSRCSSSVARMSADSNAVHPRASAPSAIRRISSFRHPDAARRPHMLRPLVLRAAEPADAQDQDLAHPVGQRGAGADVGRLDGARPEEDRVAGQRRVEIQHRATRFFGIEQAANLVGPRVPRERIQPRGVETYRSRPGRPHRALDVSRQAIREPLVRLHAETVGQRRKQDVLGAAEDRVDELRHVVAGRELVPGGITEERVAVQLIHGAQHQAVPRTPAGVRPFRHPAQVPVAQAEGARLGGQLGPQCFGTAEPGGTQAHEYLVHGRHHRTLAQIGGKRSEPVQRRGMPGQRPEQVGRPLRIDPERLDAAPDVRVPCRGIGRIRRIDPGRRGPALLRGGDGPGRFARAGACRGHGRCNAQHDAESNGRQHAPHRIAPPGIRHRDPQ